jgi:hypothetical protein
MALLRACSAQNYDGARTENRYESQPVLASLTNRNSSFVVREYHAQVNPSLFSVRTAASVLSFPRLLQR